MTTIDIIAGYLGTLTIVLIPTFIAIGRKHKKLMLIVVVNIGAIIIKIIGLETVYIMFWVGLIIWAFTDKK